MDAMNINRLLVRSAGQITITHMKQSVPAQHNSYLLIEDVLKTNNSRYTDANIVAPTNNEHLYLVPSLKLTLAGQTVEPVHNPGQAHHFSVWRAIHQHLQRDVEDSNCSRCSHKRVYL